MFKYIRITGLLAALALLGFADESFAARGGRGGGGGARGGGGVARGGGGMARGGGGMARGGGGMARSAPSFRPQAARPMQSFRPQAAARPATPSFRPQAAARPGGGLSRPAMPMNRPAMGGNMARSFPGQVGSRPGTFPGGVGGRPGTFPGGVGSRPGTFPGGVGGRPGTLPSGIANRPGFAGGRPTTLPGTIGNRPGFGGNGSPWANRPGIGNGNNWANRPGIGNGNNWANRPGIGNGNNWANRPGIGNGNNWTNRPGLGNGNNWSNRPGLNNNLGGNNLNGGRGWGGGYSSGYNRAPVFNNINNNNNFNTNNLGGFDNGGFGNGGFGRGFRPYYGNWYRGNWGGGNWGGNWGGGNWGGNGFWAGFGTGALTSFGLNSLFGYGGWGGYAPFYGGYGYGSGLGVYDYFPTWGVSNYSDWGLAPVTSSWLTTYYTNPYDTQVVEEQPAAVASVYDYSQPINLTSAPPPEATTTSTEPIFSTARDTFGAGDYVRALDLADQVLKQTPNEPVVHEFRALCLFALGRYDEAASVAYAVLSAGPGWNWGTMVGLYPDVAVYTSQLRALEAATRSTPNSGALHFLLAYHYLAQGHTDAAAGQFERVVALEPKDQLSASFVKTLRQTAAPGTAPNEVPPPPVPAGTTLQPTSAIEPQPPALVPPPASLTGTWKADPAPGTSITLTIQPDGTFSWNVTAKGQPDQAITGKCGFVNDVLNLSQANGPPLAGKVENLQPDKFVYRIMGGGTNAPGITFTR